MPRIPSNSTLIELKLSEPSTLFKTLEELIEAGVREVDVLVEPVVVETSIGRGVYSVAVNPPALIIPSSTTLPGSISGVRVLRDSWAEYIRIDPLTALESLKSIHSSHETRVGKLEIKASQSCPECSEPVVIEQLVLKYPRIPHVARLNYKPLINHYKEALREGRTILVACVKGDLIEPLVWLEERGETKILHTCKPVCGIEWIIYGSLLDAVLYLES
jgi:hypothetical protein